jgi:hypothetical protein
MDGAMLEDPPPADYPEDYQQVMPQDMPPYPEMQQKELDMPPPMEQAPEPVAYNEPMPVNEPMIEAPATDLFGQPNLTGPNTFSYTSQPQGYPGYQTQPMGYTGQPTYSGYPATNSYVQPAAGQYYGGAPQYM